MQVQAIYDDGRLELPAGVHLRHSRITLTVLIPDHEIAVGVTGETGESPADQRSREEHEGELSSPRPSIREAIDTILGPWKQQIQSGSPPLDEDFAQLRYRALEEKYLDRR